MIQPCIRCGAPLDFAPGQFSVTCAFCNTANSAKAPVGGVPATPWRPPGSPARARSGVVIGMAAAIACVGASTAFFLGQAPSPHEQTPVAMPSQAPVALPAPDPASVAQGAQLFATNCAACHGANGGGVIGPNLTDEFWIHGGSPGQIYATIQSGVQARGCPAWGPHLGPDGVRAVASYVVSIRNTHVPGGRPPQGQPAP